MKTLEIPQSTLVKSVEPLCPYFGPCGGCAYQGLPYEEELKIKEEGLKKIFREELNIDEEFFEPIVASPKAYHYRSRLDLCFIKTKAGDYFMGYMPKESRKILPIESCAIAMEPISDYLPELKNQAMAKLPLDYRRANLVIKAGSEEKVFWGGIGRRSLEMKEEDYLWAEVAGKKIFYSLDTFFQANLSILEKAVTQVAKWAGLNKEALFLDLYGGVGLFGILLAEKVKRVVIVEESVPSIKLAQFNIAYHQLSHKVEARSGRVEAELSSILTPLTTRDYRSCIALIDPPRQGLSPSVIETLNQAEHLKTLLYLSCYPPSLTRDLKKLQEKWVVKKIVPLDFFPKTEHVETLVLLKPKPQPIIPSGQALEIEIGCGTAKFLIARAEKQPEISFIGIDRIRKWMKTGKQRIEKRDLRNIRFIQAEAREFLEEFVALSSVSRFYIYFPDPWPKRRHRKRRLVNLRFLKMLIERLVPSGRIYFATDDVDYFSEVKNLAQAHAVSWGQVRESMNQRLGEEMTLTNYESKFKNQGKNLYYLEIEKQ